MKIRCQFNYLTSPVASYLYDLYKNASTSIIKTKSAVSSHRKGVITEFYTSNFYQTAAMSKTIVFPEFKIEGSLAFSYDETINCVSVTKLPYYAIGNCKIGIFTGDICKIICSELNKIDVSSFDITFKDPIAILLEDEQTLELIPSYTQTQNHRIFNGIIEGVEKERKKMKKVQESYDNQRKHNDRAYERALERKASYLGVNKVNFMTEEDFLNAIVNAQIRSWKKSLNKTARHLESTKTKLINSILELIHNNQDGFQRFWNYIKTESCFSFFAIWCPESELAKLDSIVVKEFNDLTDGDLRILIEWHLQKRLLDYKAYLDDLRTAREECKYDDYDDYDDSRPVNYGTQYITDFVRHIPRDFIRSGLYSSFENNYDKCITSGETTKSLMQALLMSINLLHSLLRLTLKHEELRQKLERGRTEALKGFNISPKWGHVLHLSYWLRLEPEFTRNTAHELYSLLMISPGVREFSPKNLLFFGSKTRHEKMIMNIDEFHFNNHNIVTVPKSMDYTGMKHIIEFIKEKNRYKYSALPSNNKRLSFPLNPLEYNITLEDNLKVFRFICQDPDTAIRLKRILLAEFTYWVANRFDFYIIVDPEYYRRFIKGTPNNYNYYHYYDFYSNQPFSRSNPLSLLGQAETAMTCSLNGDGSIDNDTFFRLLMNEYDINDELYKDYLFKFIKNILRICETNIIREKLPLIPEAIILNRIILDLLSKHTNYSRSMSSSEIILLLRNLDVDSFSELESYIIKHGNRFIELSDRTAHITSVEYSDDEVPVPFELSGRTARITPVEYGDDCYPPLPW